MFSAHRVIISACSSHFEKTLKKLPRWQHPVLIMPPDVQAEDLRDIIAFMYSGQVTICGSQVCVSQKVKIFLFQVKVERSRLNSFLRSAEVLKIRGLTMQNQQSEAELQKKIKWLNKQAAVKSKTAASPTANTLASPSASTSSSSAAPLKRPPTLRLASDLIDKSKSKKARRTSASSSHSASSKAATTSGPTVKIEALEMDEDQNTDRISVKEETEEEEHLVIQSDPTPLARGKDLFCFTRSPEAPT